MRQRLLLVSLVVWIIAAMLILIETSRQRILAKLNAEAQKKEWVLTSEEELIANAMKQIEKSRVTIAASEKVLADARNDLAEIKQDLEEYKDRPADALIPIMLAEFAETRQWLDELESQPVDALDAILHAELLAIIAQLEQLKTEWPVSAVDDLENDGRLIPSVNIWRDDDFRPRHYIRQRWTGGFEFEEDRRFIRGGLEK